MYIMDAILHRSQDNCNKNKSILENVLYTSNKKLSKYENLQKVNVNMFLSPVHKVLIQISFRYHKERILASLD